MDKFLIKGGVRLKGEVKVSGAKNAVLPIMAASLLVEGEVRLLNVPDVMDVFTMAELLRLLGARAERVEKGLWVLDTSDLTSSTAPYEIVRKMRASIYVLGPLLARMGKASVSLPGGCAFGPRPVDFHISGLEAMGASIKLEHGYINARVKKLKGVEIAFDRKSVGATAHLLMTATFAEGETLIANAAKEPEIVALADFLKLCGADIEGEGTDEIIVRGGKALRSPGEYRIIPDRIEAGTYAVAAFMTGGKVRIREACLDHIRTVIDRLRQAGATVEEEDRTITVSNGGKILPLTIHTSPYPGFPTDMQAQFMAMLTVADGTSIIKEGIYPDRFRHAFELQRMGADIKVEGDTAVIKGVKHLTGAPVMASDLRASAALVLAGLIARGETLIDRIYHLDRGYEDFEKKLSSLGANIRRIRD